MIDYLELINNKSIDRKTFLLNYYHLLNISDLEAMVLLHIECLLDNNELVTSLNLVKRMKKSKEQIDQAIFKLNERKYLEINNSNNISNIDISNVYILLQELIIGKQLEDLENNRKEEDRNIISIFEDEFNTKLTPMQKETIREWNENFNRDTILYALKEASNRQALNLAYIEKIIVSQTKVK